MKRLLPLLLSVFAVAAWAEPAQAGTVSYQFINRTSLSFDYSLQLANVSMTEYRNESYLGKEMLVDLRRAPSIWPWQISPWQSYQPAPRGQWDAVAFNMLTGDGTPYGMLPPIYFHACGIPPEADGVNMQFVLEDRGSPGDPKPVLIEYTPDGDTCEFRLSRGFGYTLWGGQNPRH